MYTPNVVSKSECPSSDWAVFRDSPASCSNVAWVCLKECQETLGSSIASHAGASCRLYRFLGLSGVPFEVANTSCSCSQFWGRSRLNTAASEALIGIVRRLLRVFGGPNSPREYVSATSIVFCSRSIRLQRRARISPILKPR